MRTEKSVAVIVFRKETDFRYLLLFRKGDTHFKDTWEFPKGLVNSGETEMQTAVRELGEETGLLEKDIKFMPEFHDKVSFFFRDQSQELVKKEVTFLLAQTTKSDIKISSEHNAYRWAPYLEGFELLTQKNTKEILRKASDYLKRVFRQRTIF